MNSQSLKKKKKTTKHINCIFFIITPVCMIFIIKSFLFNILLSDFL